MVTSVDTEQLEQAGWTAREVWDITALASFFNFTGRLEAASGLPPDEIPQAARFAEGRGS
ncbi:MAG: hypothetical protein PVI57_12190 [Gemmatimonadota bacterium]